MDIFNQINTLSILSVLDKGGIAYKKDSSTPHQYTIRKQDGKLDNSFKVNTAKNIATDFGGDGVKGGPFDIIGRLILGVDTQDDQGRAAVIQWAVSQGLVDNPQTKKDFVKSYTDKEILKKFEDLKIGGFSNAVSRFLMTRGFDHTWIQKNQIKVGEVFANIGYYDNYYCTEYETYKDENDKRHNREGDEPKTVKIIIFPCYNDAADLVGIKLRRVDGKTIRGKKSVAVGTPGLLYDGVNITTMYVVEGETDWIVLKLLGYDNVVANCGGVQSNRLPLKSLLTETDKVVCLYDNDDPGESGKKALQKTFNRGLYRVDFPIRKDKNGIELTDINDYYKAGYNSKVKWDKIFATTHFIDDGKKEFKYPFIFLRRTLEYYDIEEKTIQQTGPAAAFLGKIPKELASMVRAGQIPMYRDICYWYGGKEGYYNTMNEEVILTDPGDVEPILHPHIEYLINNICNNKKRDADWIHQSVLWKLTHINNVHIPALILFGQGSSGKGTFMNLLKGIFGEDNMQTGLGQKDLEGSFDSYKGEKLIVEFKEVSSGSTRDDKKTLDRIKAIISEDTITVNEKFRNIRQVQNSARFHFSSNHAIPLQLDSKHSGNRRFTIIETAGPLNKDIATLLNQQILTNTQTIKEYVARLYKTYPEIPDTQHFHALDNKSKKDLENNCEEIGNVVMERIENTYPFITKIQNSEKKILIDKYCHNNGDNPLDVKFKHFDNGLSHRYKKTVVRVGGQTVRGYSIKKNDRELALIPEDNPQYFDGIINLI